MTKQTWFITVKVTADAQTFRDGECADQPDELLGTIRDEIDAALTECGAEVDIIDIGDTAPGGDQ
jgi:hypothetical protein